MALLNLPEMNMNSIGNALKNQVKGKINDRVRKEIAKKLISHFVSFWWVYVIILVVFLVFYIIASAVASTQAIAAQVFVSERFLPPQMYKENLEDSITDGFGERIHPVTGEKSFHSGIDIGIPTGTPVSSSQDGVVKKVSYPRTSDPESTKNAGIYVEIESSNTEMPGTTRYLHLSNALVNVGQVVRKGQIIGLSGNTGRSTGPHLHYELIPQGLEATDPSKYILFMSRLIDVASDAAFDKMSDIQFTRMDGEYTSKPMLYISNVYMETAAPLFNESGTVLTRDMNTGTLLSADQGYTGGGGGSGPIVTVPSQAGVLQNPFFIHWAPYAMQSEITTGVKASVTLAQMALESGWGKFDICNNVFGIKANSSWKGPVCYAGTNEEDDGGTYRIRAGFRAYSSFQESFNDHALFFHQNKRYANMLRMSNPFAIANELQRVTYATDRQYANKLKSIMMNDNLMSLDRDRGIDPSTGEPWNDIPYGNTTVLSGGTNGSPPLPMPVTPTVENTTESVTITFGIQQIYGSYAHKVQRTRSTRPSVPIPTASTTPGWIVSTSGNVVTAPVPTPVPTGTSGSTGGSQDTEEVISYTNMIDPYTGKPIINLENYNNVLNLFQGETEAPSVFVKDIPDAIAVTLESDSAEDLHVARVDYIKGTY